jgi:hypothetical protein
LQYVYLFKRELLSSDYRAADTVVGVGEYDGWDVWWGGEYYL